MLKSYLTSALRAFRKQKIQSAINLSGLTIGITLALLIMFFIRNEFTFDQFHEDHERIFQIKEWRSLADGTEIEGGSNMPLPLGRTFKEEVPGIDLHARVWDDIAFVKTDNQVFQQDAYWVDPEFLSIFTFPLVEGDRESALENGVVVTESLALKLFGDRRAVGRSMEIRIGGAYQTFDVTGTMKAIPGNSSHQFDVLIPISSWIQAERSDAVGQFGWSLVRTYVTTDRFQTGLENGESLAALFRSKNEGYLERLGQREQYAGVEQAATDCSTCIRCDLLLCRRPIEQFLPCRSYPGHD